MPSARQAVAPFGIQTRTPARGSRTARCSVDSNTGPAYGANEFAGGVGFHTRVRVILAGAATIAEPCTHPIQNAATCRIMQRNTQPRTPIPMIVAGDIGGTKTLLALCSAQQTVLSRRFENRDFGTFSELFAAFMTEAQRHAKIPITGACLAVAGPVSQAEGNKRVQLTNRRDWWIDANELASGFQLDHVHLLNDFVAAAQGIAGLSAAELVTLQTGVPQPDGVRLVIGPGTGLGVAVLLRDQVLASEGGHIAFAPLTDEQIELLRFLQARHGRVSVERVVSGAGLVACHEFCQQATAVAAATISDPAEVVRRAQIDADPVALHALKLFISIFGAVAGDMALTLLPHGGVYLAGGIAPKLRQELQSGDFLAAFNAKAQHAALTASMPVYLSCVEDVGLRGAIRVGLAAAP